MIPLTIPEIKGNEWKYVKDCLDTGWVSSVGAYVSRFEQSVADYSHSSYGVATMNGTAALHISLLLSGVKPGDYVIVPNLTFVASINAIRYTGASPLLMDIDEASWQMDLDLLEHYLKAETTVTEGVCRLDKDNRPVRCIMPVHVLGGIGDMDRLCKLAERYSLTMVEDATESLGSTFRGKPAGSFGAFGCFSFNGNKIITTGGGGVLVTADKGLAEKAKHLTTQAKADPEEYYHDETGYNYRLVNVLAAMGVAQMEQLPGFIKRKKEIAAYYREQLGGVGDIRFQEHDKDCDSNEWLFTIRTERQKGLLKRLAEEEIIARPFWVPMNRLPMSRTDLYVQEKDVAGKVYSECLSIPCSSGISDGELETVTKTIKEFFRK
ncbi:LegC family aminotransferase [Roseivirga sp. BDSF3-8]|uniref:LegC family aminotransferase n=1 Tax=Roseivirga sp. BDSF3-8 TaxID=3241598 RepID=UPI0035325366